LPRKTVIISSKAVNRSKQDIKPHGNTATQVKKKINGYEQNKFLSAWLIYTVRLSYNVNPGQKKVYIYIYIREREQLRCIFKFSKIVVKSGFPKYGIPSIIEFGMNNACRFCSVPVFCRET